MERPWSHPHHHVISEWMKEPSRHERAGTSTSFKCMYVSCQAACCTGQCGKEPVTADVHRFGILFVKMTQWGLNIVSALQEHWWSLWEENTEHLKLKQEQSWVGSAWIIMIMRSAEVVFTRRVLVMSVVVLLCFMSFRFHCRSIYRLNEAVLPCKQTQQSSSTTLLLIMLNTFLSPADNPAATACVMKRWFMSQFSHKLIS